MRSIPILQPGCPGTGPDDRERVVGLRLARCSYGGASPLSLRMALRCWLTVAGKPQLRERRAAAGDGPRERGNTRLLSEGEEVIEHPRVDQPRERARDASRISWRMGEIVKGVRDGGQGCDGEG